MSFYSVMYKIFAGFVKNLFRVEAIGTENEPSLSDGGVIVCANHLSNNDVLVLSACMKRQVSFFAKAELFKIPILSSVIKGLGAFPVKRGAADVSAIKKTVEIVKNGGTVGFFPQGTRYPGADPSETKYKNGIGMIAERSHAIVLPAAIVTKNYKVVPFRKTKVIFGKPIYYDDLCGMIDNSDGKKNFSECYSEISDVVFRRIIELNNQNKFNK